MGPLTFIVHGGAGGRVGEDLATHRAGCTSAADCGWQVLRDGGSALDAVEVAVRCLEDNPLFNAGTGAALNTLGQVELDASLMDGRTLRAGAVAAVRRIKNPVGLARKLLDAGAHVLLAGEGANRFAAQAGIAECGELSLIVERQRERWHARHGTVGAVALDGRGHLAAATSTGGMFDKLPGRVGDSALIGAGTYADAHAAVSCTGVGEAIIRMALAKTAVDYAQVIGDLGAAVQRALSTLQQQTGAEAGLIAIGRRGQIAFARNTAHMSIAWVQAGTIVSYS
jgi:beta-aspartyl-peptidase (threonine type)